MSSYRYYPLANESENIRLLRLLPAVAEDADIICELLEHRLQTSSRSSYEALSYVWGNPIPASVIFVGEQRIDVTPNLYAALLRLRDPSFPRIIWIDAICIDQKNDEEKGHQIQIMADIYGKANRVLVWLGESVERSDVALEAIRAGGSISNNERDTKRIKHAVALLLQRDWFQRIWILQEVAAARHIRVVCGAFEIDGYAFCSGLEQFESVLGQLRTQVRAVTYLIRGAIFRSKLITSSLERASLNICSLGELLSMYHTHQSTRRHDKIYALLGMASDDLTASGLLPDYKIPWEQVWQRLIRYIFGGQVRIKTWGDREEAEIYGNGNVLGCVSNVTKRPDGKLAIQVRTHRENSTGNVDFTSQSMANDVQKDDIVYLVQGASKPCIVRARGFYLQLITIVVTHPFILPHEALPHDAPIVWSWLKVVDSSDRRLPDTRERVFNPWGVAIVLRVLGYDSAQGEASKTLEWLLQKGSKLQVTERDVSEVVIHFDANYVTRMLDAMGFRIAITRDMITALVQYQDLDLVYRVLGGQGDHVSNLPVLVLAAAQNTTCGSGTVHYLLKQYGHNAVDLVSEPVLIAAAGNPTYDRKSIDNLVCYGRSILGLFHWKGDVRITEAVLKAAAGNAGHRSKEILDYLLKEGESNIRVTEAVLVAAASNKSWHGKDMIKLLLPLRGPHEMLPNSVLVAAASNGAVGPSIMEQLLRQVPKGAPIPAAVIQAAKENKTSGKVILKAMLKRFPDLMST